MPRFIAIISILTFIGLAAALPSAGNAASRCDRSRIQSAAVSIVEAKRELRAAGAADDETLPPDAVRTGIERLKDQLQAFSDAQLGCASRALKAQELERLMSSEGAAYSSEKEFGYGVGLSYHVERLSSPELVVVEASQDIACGSDAVLMMYAWRGDRWTNVAVVRSPRWKEITGALSDLSFAVSRPDAAGRWFLVTARIPAWCTSVWRSTQFQVLRAGPRPEHPRLIYSAFAPVNLGWDDAVKVTTSANGFELVTRRGSLDFDNVGTMFAVHRYRVQGDSVHRIQPIAQNVRDFVDEWLETDWPGAQAWSAPSVKAPDHRAPSDARREFESVRACGAGKTQVAVHSDRGGTRYYLVSGANPFRLEAVSSREFQNCNGKDQKARLPGDYGAN